MGYSSKEAFMADFYHYFNVRIMKEDIVSLSSPLTTVEYSTSNIDFSWTALNQNIALDLEISTDGGAEWTKLLSDTYLSNYSWKVPAGFDGEFYLKFSAPGNLNVSTTYGPFQRVNVDILKLRSPAGGEFLIAGDTITIQWGSTKIPRIKIEYSTDNGTNWTEIVTGLSSSAGSYGWTIPNESSNQCLVKISDVSDPSVFDISDGAFGIGPSNNAGGPYVVDGNTILLLHFESNLTNRSGLSDDGISHGNGVSYHASAKASLGQSVKLDNSNASNRAYVSIPHNDNLNLSGDWTIEAWFFFNSRGNGSAGNPTIVSKSNSNSSNYFIWYHNSWGTIKGQFTNSNNKDIYLGIGNNTITTGKWYHIAYIRNTSQNSHKLLIHNENWEIVAEKEDKYNASESTPAFNSADLLIGKLLSSENFYLDGYLDELRISNVVRSFENTTGVPETDFGNLISIYPNPAGQIVNISTPETVDLAIFNLTGQKIMEKKAFSSGNIDVSTFKRGIYVIRFSCNKGVVSKKLIIE
jgi:hypothetical protein